MYAITGASGQTGKRIAEQLLKAGKKVRVIGRNIKSLASLEKQGAQPFVCDLTDSQRLKEAFSGVQAIYAMEPPNISSLDYRAFQDQVVDAMASAIVAAGVPFAVTLSSLGADKSAGTGMIVGQYYLEQVFNQIDSLNVMHLRAGYFMENTIAQVFIYKAIGVTGGPIKADLKLPMIATHDIADVATNELLQLNFVGSNTRELHGEMDITMTEAMAIFGRAIDVPDLTYNHLTDTEVSAALLQMGMSENVTGLILELAAAYNSGHVCALQPRSERTTTPTSYEQFVAEMMLPLYKNKRAVQES
ncbi:MAG: SDR family NAD(P)-dependent oxidoreductase [Acidobacteriota bacterium]